MIGFVESFPNCRAIVPIARVHCGINREKSNNLWNPNATSSTNTAATACTTGLTTMAGEVAADAIINRRCASCSTMAKSPEPFRQCRARNGAANGGRILRGESLSKWYPHPSLKWVRLTPLNNPSKLNLFQARLNPQHLSRLNPNPQPSRNVPSVAALVQPPRSAPRSGIVSRSRLPLGCQRNWEGMGK